MQVPGVMDKIVESGWSDNTAVLDLEVSVSANHGRNELGVQDDIYFVLQNITRDPNLPAEIRYLREFFTKAGGVQQVGEALDYLTGVKAAFELVMVDEPFFWIDLKMP
mmetsp:Transcript_30264/g.73672  ORF Transcript_30264/g.73672 Transcript_30264/m.73672 type:complete len:108 (-) Transcript_30264:1040-1363(-)